MGRKYRAVVAAVFASVMVLTVTVWPTAAQQPTITSEILTSRAVFTDDVDLKAKLTLDGRATQVVNVNDPSHTVVGRFTVQPGAQFPWHSHRGPVVVNIVQGELIYVDGDDCVERAYGAGDAFIDPGQGHVHTAFNRITNSEDTIFVATFFAAPADGLLLIPADAPTDCA